MILLVRLSPPWPTQFEQCFLRWMLFIQTVSEGEVVAIDGKKSGAEIRLFAGAATMKRAEV